MITSSIVVIATGTKPRTISALPISDDIKDRILYEINPILGMTNKKIVIIGAGDAAFDYALNLSQRNEVVIMNRSERAQCIPVLLERCLKSENISYLRQVSVREINKEDNKLLLTCIHRDSQNGNQIYADYVIVATGRDPCLDFLGGESKRNLKTLINANKLHMVGDVRNGIYRQTAICVGDGIKTAMKIYRDMGREDT